MTTDLAIAADLDVAGTLRARPLLICPAFRKMPAPLIVVGMHRSGTSLVAGMLSLLGTYMDPAFTSSVRDACLSAPGAAARRNGYGEAVAFRLVNEQIIHGTGATWKKVTPFLARREDPLFAYRSLVQMQFATFTRLNRGYLKQRPVKGANIWGWKDPRNSLTLPYWLRLFPDARILHVRRHPEAVANSLERREKAQRSAVPRPLPLPSRLLHAAAHPGAAARSIERRLRRLPPPAPTAEESRRQQDWISLSTQYVEQCLNFRYNPGGYLEIWYEDILKDPIRASSRLADFARVEAPLATVLRTAEFVIVDGRQ